MKPYKGINYDTGFEPYGPGHSSRKTFDSKVVERELKIIAEGVETAAQVAYLKKKNVIFMQGWYFARAMPYKSFAQLIAR